MRAKRKLLLIVPAVLCMGLGAIGVSVALGAFDPITASPTCCTYGQSSYNADAGSIETLSTPTGGDTLDPHDVTAKLKGPDGKPLFHSAPIVPGATGPVNGTQYLAPGTYKFFCSIHGSIMHSELVIGPGTTVARPHIDVSVPAQTLNKVRNSGKLTVKVKATTKSNGVTLLARKGTRKLGSAPAVNIPAGTTKTIKLALTGSGKSALKGLRSALVTVAGSVPFGSPDSGNRNLKNHR